MAKYTLTLKQYLDNGNTLPVIFDEIAGFKELFTAEYIDREIGFETEDLFTLKLAARAEIFIPLYKERLERYEAALRAAAAPTKTYKDTGSNTINGGERASQVSDIATDSITGAPTQTSRQDAYIDETSNTNTREETGYTVNEAYEVIDRLTRNIKAIKMNLLEEFNNLFMLIY